MAPSMILTIIATMALAGSLTLAVWHTLTRPAGSARFEDALAQITGSSDVQTDSVTLAKSGPGQKWSWNTFWAEAVQHAGRQVTDPQAPGRSMLGVAVVALFFGFAVYPGGIGGVYTPAVVLAGVYSWLTFERGKRKAALEKQLPLLLSGLRTHMNAGVTVQGALMKMADDLPSPLGDEIRQIKADVSVSVPLEQSLEALANRVESRLLRFLVSSIGIALRSGSDLIPQLVTIEEIVRQRARIDGKIHSALALAKPTAYLAMFAPIGMGGYLFLTDPQYPQYFFGPGLMMLAVAVFLYVAGLITMRVMISNVEKV